MPGHVTDDAIGQYRERSLAAAQLLAFDRHIAACEQCRERLAGREKALALLSALAGVAPEHLSYPRMADYVDRKLDGPDREIVESHAGLCARCANELRDLAAFAGEVAEARAAEPAPLDSTARGLGAISYSKDEVRTKITEQREEGNKER